MTTVWIYVDTKKEVGDVDHLKVFAPRLAETAGWSTPRQKRPAGEPDGSPLSGGGAAPRWPAPRQRRSAGTIQAAAVGLTSGLPRVVQGLSAGAN